MSKTKEMPKSAGKTTISMEDSKDITSQHPARKENYYRIAYKWLREAQAEIDAKNNKVSVGEKKAKTSKEA